MKLIEHHFRMMGWVGSRIFGCAWLVSENGPAFNCGYDNGYLYDLIIDVTNVQIKIKKRKKRKK